MTIRQHEHGPRSLPDAQKAAACTPTVLDSSDGSDAKQKEAAKSVLTTDRPGKGEAGSRSFNTNSVSGRSRVNAIEIQG